jgi:hypothetical protein
MDDDLGRMPVLASVADASRNIGNAWSYGFNFGNNLMSGNIRGLVPKMPHIRSVGGLTTLGGLGSAGAMIGAAIGSQLEGDPIGPAAAVGGAIGTAILPMAGLAASAVWPMAKGVAKTSVAVAKATPAVAANVAKFSGAVLNSAPVRTAAAAPVGFAKSLINWNVDAKNMTGVKLSKVGAGVLVGAAAFGAIKEGFNEINTMHMGQNDGMVRRATPSYLNNAGATGDLVFALNANRRG